MICGSCGYKYALSPKSPPMLSDMAVKNAVDRVSALGTYYFTQNQLTSQLIHLKQKKEKRNQLGCFFAGVFAIIAIAFGVINFQKGNPFGWVLLIVAALIVVGMRKMGKMPVSVSYPDIKTAVETYRRMHPIEKLVDGTRFEGVEDTGDSDLLEFAPERILIVQHDDVADMLILNGFHMEQKTLVLSAEKYPSTAFEAYRKIIARYPDTPIALMHDASEAGLRMKARLIKDSEWMLEGKRLEDLGLSPKDVSKLKTPIWIPTQKGGEFSKKSTKTGGDAMESINEGYSAPLDAAPPKALLGAAGLALLVGAPLLSEAFVEEQMKQASGTEASGGGFGYG